LETANYLDLLAKCNAGGSHPGGFYLTRKILSGETINGSTVLLDVGCGTGQTSSFIAKNYSCTVIAVDNNEKMLEKAALRFKHDNATVNLMSADGMQLPLPASSVDIVLSESVTIFTIIPDALKEYARILKPGGTLICVEITADAPLSAEELREMQSVYGIEQVPAQDEWLGMLEQAGFSDIDITRGKMSSSCSCPKLSLAMAFSVNLHLMRRCYKKIGYRVFRCQNKELEQVRSRPSSAMLKSKR
jgi:SAM-dependent methyltransferase